MTALRARALVIVVAAVALFAAACGDSGSDDSTAAAEPQLADTAQFTAATLGGGEFDAESVKGKDTVLWFWAPWCTVCRAEAPDVVEAAAEFDGSVEVIGVAGRGEVPEMEQFVDDTGTGGLQHMIDSDGAIWSQFGVAAQPAFAFIDDNGEIEVFIGALGREALTERMQALAAA
jgi:thiol-disulfide isomerase/thioredoxin